MQSTKIVHRDSFKVMGISCQSTMNNNVIPALWDKFNRIANQIPGLETSPAYGVCYFEDAENMTDDTPFTYLAGFEVDPLTPLPEHLEEHFVPASDYAVFEHLGSLSGLHDTYAEICTDWFPSSGYERAKTDDFEVYDDRFKYGHPDSVMEIWIPVIKK